MLSDKIKVFQNCARINFEKDGYLKPAIIAEYYNSEVKIFGAEFENSEDKENFSKFLQKEIIEKQLVEYIFVAESWMSNYDSDGSFVKKIEALTMTHCSKFLPYELGYYSEIERSSTGDYVRLKDWVEFGKTFASGNFCNLFQKCSYN